MKTIPVIPIDLALPPKQRWQNVPKPVLAAALRLAKKQKAIVPTDGFLSLGLRAITKAVNPYRDDISFLNSSPLRNEETKTQVAMSPRTGSLAVFGMENKERVSELLIARKPSKKRPARREISAISTKEGR